LSYLQLVEVAFVATLRHMGVSLRRIRIARDFLESAFGMEYPFATMKLQTDGARVLYDLRDCEGRWAERLLGEASAAGQVIWADPIRDRITEFQYEHGVAIRWFPRGRAVPIVVDPQVQFGTPILADSALPTLVVKERYQAGETIQEIKQDFGIEAAAIRHALVFEGISPTVAAA